MSLLIPSQYPAAPDGATAALILADAEATTTGTGPTTKALSAQSTQALDSNASAVQCLVSEIAISSEYPNDIVGIAALAEHQRVEPLARAALSNPATTMDNLHRMSENELNILESLTNHGKQRLKDRLMRIWDEMARRFELGETLTINETTISGTRGKGMGKYLRLIGIDPAKRRFWKFEIKQKDMLVLAREIAPGKPKSIKKKNTVIEGETEAHHIAKWGLRIAQTLAEESMVSPQERVNRAQTMSKELLEAVAGGNYEVPEIGHILETRPLPERVTYADWQNYDIPAAQYKLQYFEDASRYFWDRYFHAFQSSPFKKILGILEHTPEKVLSNADDFAQIAIHLGAAADKLNVLASAITSALTNSKKHAKAKY